MQSCKVAKLQILGDFSAPIFDRGERMPRTTEKPNGGSWAIFRVPTLTEASRRPRTNEKPKRRILVDLSGPKFDRGERMSQNNRKTQRRRSFGSWVAKLRACTTCKVAKLRACVKPLRACGHEALACMLQDDAASVRSVCANRPLSSKKRTALAAAPENGVPKTKLAFRCVGSGGWRRTSGGGRV